MNSVSNNLQSASAASAAMSITTTEAQQKTSDAAAVLAKPFSAASKPINAAALASSSAEPKFDFDAAETMAIASILHYDPRLQIHDFGVFSAKTLFKIAQVSLLLIPAKNNIDCASRIISFVLNGPGMFNRRMLDHIGNYFIYLDVFRMHEQKRDALIRMYKTVYEALEVGNCPESNLPLWDVKLSKETVNLLQKMLFDVISLLKPVIEHAFAHLKAENERIEQDSAQHKKFEAIKETLGKEKKKNPGWNIMARLHEPCLPLFQSLFQCTPILQININLFQNKKVTAGSCLQKQIPKFQEVLKTVDSVLIKLREEYVKYEVRSSFLNGVPTKSYLSLTYLRIIYESVLRAEANFYKAILEPINLQIALCGKANASQLIVSDSIQHYLCLISDAILERQPAVFPEPQTFSRAFYSCCTAAAKKYTEELQKAASKIDDDVTNTQSARQELEKDFSETYKSFSTPEKSIELKDLLDAFQICFAFKYKILVEDAYSEENFEKWREIRLSRAIRNVTQHQETLKTFGNQMVDNANSVISSMSILGRCTDIIHFIAGQLNEKIEAYSKSNGSQSLE